MAVTSGNGEFDKLARDNTSYREPTGSAQTRTAAPVLPCKRLVLHGESSPARRGAHTAPRRVLHSLHRAAHNRLSALCPVPCRWGVPGLEARFPPSALRPGSHRPDPVAAGPDAARRLRASVSPVRPARSWPCLPPRTLAPTCAGPNPLPPSGNEEKCHRRENPCRRRMWSRPAGSAAKGQRGDCRTRRSKTPPCPLPNAARRAAWHRSHRPTAFGSGTAHPRRGPFPRCLISPVMS